MDTLWEGVGRDKGLKCQNLRQRRMERSKKEDIGTSREEEKKGSNWRGGNKTSCSR